MKSSLIALLSLYTATTSVSAASVPTNPRGVNIPLKRRNVFGVSNLATADELGAALKDHRDRLMTKYDQTYTPKPSSRKRAAGSNLLVNQDGDS